MIVFCIVRMYQCLATWMTLAFRLVHHCLKASTNRRHLLLLLISLIDSRNSIWAQNLARVHLQVSCFIWCLCWNLPITWQAHHWHRRQVCAAVDFHAGSNVQIRLVIGTVLIRHIRKLWQWELEQGTSMLDSCGLLVYWFRWQHSSCHWKLKRSWICCDGGWRSYVHNTATMFTCDYVNSRYRTHGMPPTTRVIDILLRAFFVQMVLAHLESRPQRSRPRYQVVIKNNLWGQRLSVEGKQAVLWHITVIKHSISVSLAFY